MTPERDDEGHIEVDGSMEAKVKLMEGVCKGTKRRVLVGRRMSAKFNVNFGLRQGSSLTPLMFITGDGTGKQEGTNERNSVEDVVFQLSDGCS